MLPAPRDLTLYQGDTFAMTVGLKDKTVDGLAGNPVNLTGCTARAQIRATTAATTVLAEFACTITTPTAGKIDLELTPAQTATLVSGVWDLQITFPDSRVYTVAAGALTTVAEVTRGP